MKGCEKSGNESYLLDIKVYLVFFLHELTTKCVVIVAYPQNFVVSRWSFSIT